MRRLLYITSCLLITVINLSGQSFIKFKENKKQWPDKVKYMGTFYNSKVFLTENSFVYDILNEDQLTELLKTKESRFKNDSIEGHVYETKFLHSNKASISTEDKQSEYYNYFVGSDKTKWSTKVNAYKKIIYKDLYEHINLNVYSSGTSLKYDFVVAPHADPSNIEMEIRYADEVNLFNNIIEIKTNAGIIKEESPLAFQIINKKKVLVDCDYKLKRNVVSFEFPNGYNPNYELVIDPVVVACSFTGSTGYSTGEASAYDEKGNGYLAGFTQSSAFPATMGAYQTTLSGSNDATIHKFNKDGSQLLFCTYLGGSLDETTYCMDVFGGNIFLLGYTSSDDFPVGSNTIDNSYNGGGDLFLIKMDTTGSNLINSTYLGGSGDDGPPGAWLTYSYRNYEFVLDKNCNIYLVSSTTSSDFPVSAMAYSTNYKGAYDGVVLKIDSSLQNIVWSTFLGGTNDDYAIAIRLDKKGGIYVSGSTRSNDFPVTAGAVSTNLNSLAADCFITHLDSNGTTILASTYIGTIGTEYSYGIALDNDTNVYLYAILLNTITAPFSPTPNTFYVAGGHNFLYKFSPDLTQLLIKTRFGPIVTPFSPSGYYLTPAIFELDSCNNIYIAGDASSHFMTTPNAIKSSTTNFDLYFCVLSPNAASLKFATYYGGPNDEYSVFGICKLDKKGIIYYSFVGGVNTPVTTNAYSASAVAGTAPNDHGLIKIDLQTFLSATSYSSQLNNGCAPYDISFQNQSATNNVTWIFGDGSSPVNNLNSVSHIYDPAGDYNMFLIAEDTSTCNKIDTLITAIHVFDTPKPALPDSIDMCKTGTVELNAANPGLSYNWSTSESTQFITVNSIGTYYVTISNPGCSIEDTSVVYLSKANFPIIVPNIITPNGDGVNDKLVITDLLISEYNLYVYDRWGRLILQTDQGTWDGSVKGNVIDGTYYYVLNYKTECVKEWQNTKGFITVVK